MGWVRRVTTGIVAPPTIIIATVLGTVAALLWSPPGRSLTARLATDLITSRVAGSVHIGKIRGNVLSHVGIEDLRIADSLGEVVVDAPRVEARYALTDLIAGRTVLSELRADNARIHLVRSASGYWNYERVFRTRKDDTLARTPPSLTQLANVTLRDAYIRIDVATTPGPPRQPMTRNARPPAQPRIEQRADGPVRVYELSNTYARLPMVRISTPQRDPILVRIAELRTRLSDPAMTITSAVGEIVTAADSLRFTLDQASLPGTTVRGAGTVRWPRGPLLFDFTLDADTVDLADLRWISPDFPSWTGKGRVVAVSRGDRRTDYSLSSLVLGAGEAQVAGQLVAIVDLDRGLGMGDLDLALRAVPLDVARPYLDTLPFRGTLTGRLTADGFLDRMSLAGNLTMRDALVRGAPESDLDFRGIVRFGGAEGAVFEGFALRDSRIALATVERIVPAVVIPGDLRLTGTLDGPWLNARFEGRAEHIAPNAARSIMTGSVRFDARSTVLGLALDADFAPLSFDALRTGYPSLTPIGQVRGRVTANGPMTALDLIADLEGEIGVVHARGQVGIDGPRFLANGLVLDVERLDLRALLARGASTSLNGRIMATGVIDSVAAPIGTLDVDLGASVANGFALDAVIASASASDGIIRIDSSLVSWRNGVVTATGTLGWASPDSGSLAVQARVDSLAPLDSVVRAVLKMPRDTTGIDTLRGAVDANLTVSGSLDHLDVAGSFSGRKLALDGWHLATVDGSIRADSLGALGLVLTGTGDSLASGARLVRHITFGVNGTLDSLHVGAGGRVGLADVRGGGRWLAGDPVSTAEIDSLAFDLPRQRWRLLRPVSASMADAGIVLSDTVLLRTADGSGEMMMAGTVPGDAPGELRVAITGLDLSDIFAVMYSDTTLGSGIVSANVRIDGTRIAPEMRGNASVTGPVLGDVRAPMLRGAFDYRDQRLRSNLSFWRTGESVLEIDLSLPYDLALEARASRRLPGAIDVTALADSADLSLLEAFTPSIRSARGMLRIDMRGTGTWEQPRLEGTVAIVEGRMTLPDLGVRYGPIDGVARFSGDSLVIDTLRMSSGEGDATIVGNLRFRNLTSPELDFTVRSEGFLAVDVPGFMKLRPTGSFALVGPVTKPVMRGTAGGLFIDDSDIYFADLLTKNVINLDDPRYAKYVDTVSLRRQGLSARFQSRFLDSLRIEPIRIQIGTDVWLKSAEANIQLEGEVVAEKTGQVYGLVGNLNTPRGSYTVKIPPFNIDFDVLRGSVRYFGTPDLNAALDILATNTVRTQDGDEIQVQAQIGGTILVPTLRLTAPGRNIPERDLISYLIFGRPEFDVVSSNAATAQGVRLALGAIATELERVLASEDGLGVETVEIRPGGLPGQGTSFTTAAIGRQFGDKWFVTGNVGVCLGQRAESFSARNFGASVEYRFARNWRAQASAEPVQACSSNRASDLLNNLQGRYQLGFDLLWDREY